MTLLAGIGDAGIQQQAGAFERTGGEHDDLGFREHFALRMAVNEMGSVNEEPVDLSMLTSRTMAFSTISSLPVARASGQ